MLVELVGREYLVNAVALNSMTFNGARIIGPALAGIMIAGAASTFAGISLVLFVNAITFVAVLIGLLMMDKASLHISPPVATGGMGQLYARGAGLYLAHTGGDADHDHRGGDRHLRLQL